MSEYEVSDYDEVNGVLPKITIDLMVNEWEGGNENQLYNNLCDVAASHEVLRQALREAAAYLLEGKRKHYPNTTNSLVDDFIEKWMAEDKIKIFRNG